MTSIPIEEDWSKSRSGGGRNGVLCEHMAGDISVGVVFEPLNVQMAFTATTFMEVGWPLLCGKPSRSQSYGLSVGIIAKGRVVDTGKGAHLSS